MAYTGTAAEILFKQRLERMLEKNELSGRSPYVLQAVFVSLSQVAIGAGALAGGLLVDRAGSPASSG